MMRLALTIALTFALTGCKGDGDKPSGDDKAAKRAPDEKGSPTSPSKAATDKATAASPEQVARAFADAVIARDTKTAAALLVTVEACAQAPADQREGCKAGAVAMRDQLESLYDDFPATMKIDRVAKSAEELAVAHVTAWDIFADGKATPAAAIFVVTMDGKSYASYPTRRLSEDTDVEVPEIVEP